MRERTKMVRASDKLEEAIRDPRNASAHTAPPMFEERHLSPAEIGSMWNLSEDAVRRLFEKEPGVLVLANPKPGRRRYRTLRIPESVALHVYGRLSLSGS